MSKSQRGSTLAGIGGMTFGVLTAAANVVGGAPGGNYVEADVASYVGASHFPIVIATGYLAVLGVVGLICLIAYLREVIGAQPDRANEANIFWGTVSPQQHRLLWAGDWSPASPLPRLKAAVGHRSRIR